MIAALLFAVATLVVHVGQPRAPVNPLDLGVSYDTWYNMTLSGLTPASGATLGKFPAGAQVDIWDWQTAKDGPKGTPCAGNADPVSTLDAYVRNVLEIGQMLTLIGVNYGSNPQCTGGNTPANAAAFVSYVIKNYGPELFPYWTLGNEQYAPGAVDCRQPGCKSSRNPTTYATNEGAFYTAMHAAGANNVCIPFDLANPKNPWNAVVATKARYECAEVIYYPQRTLTSDSFLLKQAVPQLRAQLATLRATLTAAGHQNTPIILAAVSSALGPYGKQSQSIVGALYAAMEILEAENDGVAANVWHIAVGSCDVPSQGGDFRPTVYGWQTTYGGAMIYSDGPMANCPIPAPRGTMLATANALLVASKFVAAGGNMVNVTLTGHQVVAYASNAAALIVNLNQTQSKTVNISVDGVSSGAAATGWVYDKALYDESQYGIWAPAATMPVPAWTGSLTLRVPPWSAVVVPL